MFLARPHLVRRNLSLWTRPQPYHFTPHASLKGEALITEAFSPLKHNALSNDKLVGLEIRHDIILEAYHNALRNQERPSRVFQLISAIPKNLDIDKKLGWLAVQFKKYPLMPVITSHPTYPLNIQAIIDLCHMVDTLIHLENGGTHSLKDKTQLVQTMRAWAESRLVPQENLTPHDEADFALFLYQRILSTFPEFHQQIVNKFQATHGGEYEMISAHLKAPVMESFRHVFSWCMADFDGNRNRTRETLERTVPSQQHAILELYLSKLKTILKQLTVEHHLFQKSVLNDIRADFERCIEAIKTDIWFDLSGSRALKAQILSKLEKVIRAFKANSADEHLAVSTGYLHDLIDLAGFFGGLKEYTRQTTQLNQRVLSDLCSLLVDEFREIKMLMNGHTYPTLSPQERQKLLTELSKHPRYFEQLKKSTDSFSDETKQELARLSFILEHQDIFPSYIFSDTEDKTNLDEVLLLFHFSSYLSGTLRIGQIRQYPVNPLILCESPKDINNFSATLSAIFEDPAIRNRMAKSYFFSYVGGPSDLGKKGGIFVYVSLLRSLLDAAKTLELHQKEDETLANVQLRVLHGFGGDMKRRNGAAALEAHSTQQHFDALINLGATSAYLGFLHRAMGHPSESYFRAQELERLKNHYPEALDALELMESSCIKKYSLLVDSAANKHLLSYLTSFELERALNVSSRAGSKANLDDPTNVRAIGVVNLYLLAGIQWDIFMSLEGLLSLPPNTLQHAGLLLNELTVLKDIVYKVWFSIAVSDFENAWLRVHGSIPSYSQIEEWAELHQLGTAPSEQQLHCMLAHIEITARKILKQSTIFLSESEYEQAEAYFNNIAYESVPTHTIALEFMDCFEGEVQQLSKETRELIPYFKRLRACVEAYEENPSTQTKENVVLACRGGGWIVTGPKVISEKICPLHQEALGQEPEQVSQVVEAITQRPSM
ncbi:MAG: phosphoenolpyruvate carboxylase [Legionellaceae bacterium]|nr:phosphoenolpyruvate carboxylase [Legionellaceae bacterium]